MSIVKRADDKLFPARATKYRHPVEGRVKGSELIDEMKFRAAMRCW